MRKVANAVPPSQSSPSGVKRYHNMPAGYGPGQRDWEPGNVVGSDGKVWHECIVTEPPNQSGEDSQFDKFKEMGYEVSKDLSTNRRIYRLPVEQFIANRRAAEKRAEDMRKAPIVHVDGAHERREHHSLDENELLSRIEAHKSQNEA